MSELDDIKNILTEKMKEVMKSNDPELMMKFNSTFMTPFKNLEEAKERLDKIQNRTNDNDIDYNNSTVHLSKLAENHHQIAEVRAQNRTPHLYQDFTVIPLLKQLPISPYSKTTDFFGGGIGSTVIVERGNRVEAMSAHDVMTSVFPGMIAYRWGGKNRVLVPIGSFYQDFRCDLTLVHDFEEEVQHTFENGRQVKLLRRLNCQPIAWLADNPAQGYPICSECLSLNLTAGSAREQCEHLRNDDPVGCRQFVSKIRSNIKQETIELNPDSRTDPEIRNNFLPVFNQIFEEIAYLDNLEFLTFARGFRRRVTLGHGTHAYEKSVFVEYNPYPGYTTTTNGLILKLKPIPEEFIDHVINDGFIVRDVLIDIFVQEIENIIKDNPFPQQRDLYEVELILSGVIKVLGLDRITATFDLSQIVSQLNTDQFRTDFQVSVLQELNFYSNQKMPTDIIQIYGERISKLTISIDNIRLKIKELIKNSLCYLAYVSGQITSGTDQNELSFMIPKNDDIIIYDNVEGGNGASKLIFQYLGDENSTNHAPPSGSLKPAYFQETFLELLLPCSQGVTERVHFQGLEDIFSNFKENDLITYRFAEIRNQENLSPNEFAEVQNAATIRNMFPYSIGKRSLNFAPEENKKIQEAANICVHGCAECILLNSWSGPSIPRLERYYVSKYLVDQYFRFSSERIRVNVNVDDSAIETTLEEHNSVIISQTIDTGSLDLGQLLARVNSFIGKKITTQNGEKVVKFTGIWFDCQIADSPEVEVPISMGVV